MHINILKNNGFPMKHALIILLNKKHVQIWQGVKIVYMDKDVGHKEIIIFIQYHNMEQLKEPKKLKQKFLIMVRKFVCLI